MCHAIYDAVRHLWSDNVPAEVIEKFVTMGVLLERLVEVKLARRNICKDA